MGAMPAFFTIALHVPHGSTKAAPMTNRSASNAGATGEATTAVFTESTSMSRRGRDVTAIASPSGSFDTPSRKPRPKKPLPTCGVRPLRREVMSLSAKAPATAISMVPARPSVGVLGEANR